MEVVGGWKDLWLTRMWAWLQKLKMPKSGGYKLEREGDISPLSIMFQFWTKDIQETQIKSPKKHKTSFF